jgi:hypothetical protein
MDVTAPVCFFSDPLSVDLQRLLFDRRFDDFWQRVNASAARSVDSVAIESIAHVLRRSPTIGFCDVSLILKLTGRILSLGPLDRVERPLKNLLVPNLERILLTWLPDRMDEVYSFIKDLLSDPILSGVGETINLSILKVRPVLLSP